MIRKSISIIVAVLLSMTIFSGVGTAEEGNQIPTANLAEILEDQDFTKEEIQTVQLVVPDNFFYFLNSTIESFKLRLTWNDYGKASVLAEFAEERIDAASILIQAGLIEEANTLIDDAMDHYLLASEYDPSFFNEEIELEKSVVVLSEEKKAGNQEIPQSVISLLRNIEKIDNPKAKSALKRNIERKLEKGGMDIKFTEDTELSSQEEDKSSLVTVIESKSSKGNDKLKKEKEIKKNKNLNRGKGNESGPPGLQKRDKKEKGKGKGWGNLR